MALLPDPTANPTLLNINSLSDVRAFIHSAAPSIAGVLLGASAFTTHQVQVVTAVVALVVALTDASLSSINTASGFRRWFYPVLAGLGSALTVVGLVAEQQWLIVAAIVPIFLGTGTASANTDTTPAA